MGAGQLGGKIEEAALLARAVLAGPQPGSRRQGADATIKGMGLGDVAPQEKPDVAGAVGRGVDAAAGQQRLDLGGGLETTAALGDIKRLDAEGVAGQQQAAPRLVPQGEGEHPDQAVEHGDAQTAIQGQQHLGVAAGVEHLAGRLAFRPQLAVIVDLAVEDDAQGPVGAGHRLRPGLGQVDDRQPAVGQADGAVGRQP